MKYHPFLESSQIGNNNKLNENISKISLKGLEFNESAEEINKYQDRYEDGNVLVVDDFGHDDLNYFFDLSLRKRNFIDDDQLPVKHSKLFWKFFNKTLESKEFFRLINKHDFFRGSFDRRSRSLIETLSSLVKKSFPDYKFSLMEPTWRLYPICVGSLHVDEFDHYNDRQVLRLLLNIDHLPRVVAFSEPIWDTILKYESVVKPEWPSSISECVRYFQEKYLQEMKLERYKLEMNTILLKPGSFWIGNPSAISHCGVVGFKALVLDFEFDCDDFRDKEKSFKSRWESVTRKRFDYRGGPTS